MVQASIVQPSAFPTRYWHELEDGRIQCDLCPRACKLREGQQGLCFVRERQDDAIVLTSYGRSSGFCIDPIEKKPLNHFLPGTPVLSFGTAGCNLACKFCQNWDISKSREFDTLADQASPEAIAQAAKKAKCRSVAFTYNDPVIFHEYAVDVAQACREVGIKAVAVTAGYVCPEPRNEFYQLGFGPAEIQQTRRALEAGRHVESDGPARLRGEEKGIWALKSWTVVVSGLLDRISQEAEELREALADPRTDEISSGPHVVWPAPAPRLTPRIAERKGSDRCTDVGAW